MAKDDELGLDTLTPQELLKLAQKVAQIAVEAREGERSEMGVPKPEQFGAKDPLVRKMAAVGMDYLRTPKAKGGREMSYRDIAALYGVSYEGVRKLAKSLEGLGGMDVSAKSKRKKT